MPTVISYGEDALTYWAITARTGEILAQLRDDSAAEDTLVIYRPSFGRRGKAKGEVRPGTKSAQFGELDAILATGRGIYLVESKWQYSSELRNGLLTLRTEQVLRHQIFTWYLQHWFEDRPGDWPAFVALRSEAFELCFPGNRLAPAGSRLACNLQYLLDRLSAFGRRVQNVLLYLALQDSPLPSAIKPDEFALVTLTYHALGSSGCFELSAPGTR